MMKARLVVSYKDTCDVFANGGRVGQTNKPLILAPDEYNISITTPDGSELHQDVVLADTDSNPPKTITFS